MSHFKRFGQVFRIVFSLVLISWLVFNIDFSTFAFEINPRVLFFLLIAMVFAFGDRVLMVYKWDVLLRARDIELPFWRLTGQYLSATFLGLFLPATVGADAVRAYAVSRNGVEIEDVISSIIIERVLGVVALLIFVLASIFLSVYTFGQEFFESVKGVSTTAAILLTLLLAFGVLSMNRGVLARLSVGMSRLSDRYRKNRYLQKIKEVYVSYLKYQDQKPILLRFLFLSFLENLFPIALSYFLSLALGIEVPVLFFFILVPIVLLLVRIPISIDGIGIQEGSFVYFLGLIGVASSKALLLGVLTHIAAIVSVLPGGVLYGFFGFNLRTNTKIDLATLQESPERDLEESSGS